MRCPVSSLRWGRQLVQEEKRMLPRAATPRACPAGSTSSNPISTPPWPSTAGSSAGSSRCGHPKRAVRATPTPARRAARRRRRRPPGGRRRPAGWTTYVWVDSADDTVARSRPTAAGWSPLPSTSRRPAAWPSAPTRRGRPSGSGSRARTAVPSWSTRPARGTSATSAPRPRRGREFYGAVFGWVADPFEMQPDRSRGCGG